MVADNLEKINTQNQAMKEVLVTAISKMMDLFIKNPPAMPAEEAAEKPGQSPIGGLKLHKCTYTCPPHCCKLYDD